MKKIKMGIFGCGNMGNALGRGIKSQFPDVEFFLYNPTLSKAEALALKIKGSVIKNAGDMPDDLDWYLLGFKPQSLNEFNFPFKNDSKVISILAGVSTSKLISKFKTQKIARLMPNTPSSLGLGANLLFLNSYFTDREVGEINLLLNAIGKTFKMQTESDLDLTTPFSGSGPALLFELARVFEAELHRLTDGRVPAKEIITQTFMGSAALMQSEDSFVELKNQVTSKKGVTYEALKVLEENNLEDIFKSAFKAAYNRTLELSK